MHLLTKGTLFKTGGLEPKMILSAIDFAQLRFKSRNFLSVGSKELSKNFYTKRAISV